MGDLKLLLQVLEALEAPGPWNPEWLNVVNDFNTKYDRMKSIEKENALDKRRLWCSAFRCLIHRDPHKSSIVNPLLILLRILSRDKETLEDSMTDADVAELLKSSGLVFSDRYHCHEEHLNGMKIIFNMIFQSETLQDKLIEDGLLNVLVNQVLKCIRFRELHSEYFRDCHYLPWENQQFLLKTFFLITALNKRAAQIVRRDLNGIEVLVDFMDATAENSPDAYDSEVMDVMSEALKVTYNILHDIFPNKTDLKADLFNAEDYRVLRQLCKGIRRNLVHGTTVSDKKLEMDNHSIHLLTVVPYECFEELLVEAGSDVQADSISIFEGYDLSAVEVVIGVLNVKLNAPERSHVEPVLLVLYRMASKNRTIRRYLKQRILPPLTKEDLRQRPEIGSSIRNKLCSIIHTPSGHATEVAVNFLFVLCKEKVRTLVKYTGYGNAAGLLASRGLMLGGQGDSHYSDESDENECDEYNEVTDQINPIEGWIKPKDSPIEMTEEQKEHEAMKLVQTIEKLSASHLIQPCRIGPDGKPQPIEHVLELQEALESTAKNASRLTISSDTDSE